MDECCSDDDTSAEIPSEEVNVERYSEPWNSFGEDGKEGSCRGAKHDNKERRDSSPQLAIVLIAGRFEGTDDVSGIGGVEVDVAGVESRGGKIIGRHDLGRSESHDVIGDERIVNEYDTQQVNCRERGWFLYTWLGALSIEDLAR